MKNWFVPFAIFLAGIICFGSGVALRFRAADAGAKAVAGASGINWAKAYGSEGDAGASAKADLSKNMALAQRSNAMYDVANPLLWTGGALIVLTAIALLFVPAWRLGRSERAAPGIPAAGDATAV